jgi:iron complex outermembrane recepter protein
MAAPSPNAHIEDRHGPRSRLRSLAATCLALTLGLGMDVFGQTAPHNDSDTQNQAPGQALEMIVVTAGKRKENQRELAGTVSVVEGEDLERRGVQDQEDLFKLTPGVQFNKGDPERALPTIRGIGTVPSANAIGLQQATTGVYIEDVPFTDPFGFVSTADLAPFDLQRVEVLRGPQGALYGSASLGGAIRYLTNKPNLQAADFGVASSLSSIADNGVGHAVYVMGNFPIVADVAALRAVAFDRRDPGYIRNVGTGDDEANGLHQTGGRLIGTVKPTGSTTITGLFLTQKTQIEDGFAVSPDPNQLQINTPSRSPRTSQFTFGNLQIDIDLGHQTLTSNTGYFDKKADAAPDLTRRFGGIGAIIDPSLPVLPWVSGPTITRGKSVSQEFRVASSGETALRYVAGVFYQRTTYAIDAAWTAPGGAALWGKLGAALLPNDVLLREVDSATATEKAVFADLEYGFSNGISLSAGGREYRNTLSYDVNSVFLTDPLVGQQSLSESGFTPKFSVKYRFGDNLWYALASKGYRFGGVNVNPPTFSRYKSDSLWNYETGLRLAAARSLTFDLSVFVLDWKNAQVNAITPGAIPVNGIANVGAARVKGAEFATNWIANRHFSVSAALAYTDATTSVDFTNSSHILVPSGSRLPGTAKFQSTVQGQYRFSGPFETAGHLDVTHSYTGYRVFTIEGQGQAPGYGIVDLRLAFEKDHWEAGIFADNVGDKRGITGAQAVVAFGAPSYTDYFLVRPRTVGVSFRYQLSP